MSVEAGSFDPTKIVPEEEKPEVTEIAINERKQMLGMGRRFPQKNKEGITIPAYKPVELIGEINCGAG